MTAGRRDQLASALPESLGPVGLRRPAIPALGVDGAVTGYGEILLDALLPTVDRMIRQAQAEALESAAEVAHLAPMRAADLIRARAVALRPTTDHLDVTQDGPRTPSEPP